MNNSQNPCSTTQSGTEKALQHKGSSQHQPQGSDQPFFPDDLGTEHPAVPVFSLPGLSDAALEMLAAQQVWSAKSPCAATVFVSETLGLKPLAYQQVLLHEILCVATGLECAA